MLGVAGSIVLKLCAKVSRNLSDVEHLSSKLPEILEFLLASSGPFDTCRAHSQNAV